MVLLVEAALISPPEGINLYVLHGVRQDVDREEAERTGEERRQTTIADVWIGVLPFMGCIAFVTVLVLRFRRLPSGCPTSYSAPGSRLPSTPFRATLPCAMVGRIGIPLRLLPVGAKSSPPCGFKSGCLVSFLWPFSHLNVSIRALLR